MQLNLQKSSVALQLSLQKKGILTPPVIDVGFALDVSGSFEDEHQSGQTTLLMSRLVPWGLAFDPDKKVDVFTFSNGAKHAHHVGELTDKNYDGYVKREIVGKVPGWNCGTDYSYVLEKILQFYGWLPGSSAPAAAEQKPRGFMSRIFGGKQEQPAAVAAAQPAPKRTVIFVLTDGENSDGSRTREVLKAAQSRGSEVYVMFLGISNENVSFSNIRSYGDEFDNTGFLRVPNLNRFVNMADEELNEQLLVPELLEWLRGGPKKVGIAA